MANQEKFFVEYGVDTDATTSFKVPAGTTAQRDTSPESGLFRYNTTNNQFEGYSNGSWGEIGGSSLGQSFDVDTFTGDNSTTAFTLGRSVSSEDYLIVFIDGVFQAQDAYTLSGTTLTLDSPPATGSSIIAYSVVPISVAEIPADTDDLTEGSTNLYFTNARVDSRLSSGSVATIETTGNVTVGGDLSVSGGLTVSGTTTTVNSTTTSVTDSMIELANSNTSSDVIDIGIYGNYDDGLSEGGVSEYTGLFRDASDSTWKLFDGLEEEPTTTVNTAGTNYAKAALEVGDLDATTILTTDINLENTGGNAVIDIKASNTGLSRVNLGDTDGSTRGGLKYDHSNDSMAFRANGSDQMTLTNTGLGIGTDDPSYYLHVVGSGDTVAAVTAAATSIAALNLGNSTNLADGGIRYDNAADALIFRASNAEKTRITSGGDVGIGTDSPDARLHLVNNSSNNFSTSLRLEQTYYADIYSQISSNFGGSMTINAGQGSSSATLNVQVNGSEKMRLNTGGDAHIGLNDNDVLLYLGSAGGAFGGNSSNNVRASDSNLMLNTPGQFIVEKSGSLGLLMDTDKTFYVRPATSSDNFGMYVRTSNSADTGIKIGRTGTNNAEMGIKVASNGSNSFASFKFAISDAASWSSDDWFKLKVSGEMDGNFNDTSDRNLKENIVSIPNGDLAKVMQLNPVTFDWKNEVSRNDQTGFIAQEVETIFPNEVLGDEYDVEVEGSGKSINTIGLLSHTVKALQELKTIVDTLETRIETLENE